MKAKAKKKVAPRKKPGTHLVKVDRQDNQIIVRSLNNPEHVMSFGVVLKKFIVENHLSVNIEGNDYAMVSAWQYAGIAFGLTAVPEDPVRMHEPGQYTHILYKKEERTNKKSGKKYMADVVAFVGFESDAEVMERMKSRIQVSKEEVKPYYEYSCKTIIKRIGTEEVISQGVATCSNLEKLKATFEQHAVASMCQTRSIGKAYRNLLGFIMKSAGYQDTPAEEMQGVKVEEPSTPKKDLRTQPNQKQFEAIVAHFTTGDMTMDHINYHYNLTPEQQATLKKKTAA